MKLRIASNVPAIGAFRRQGIQIEHRPLPPDSGGMLPALRFFRQSRTWDYLVINGSGPTLFWMAAAKFLMPRSKVRIVSLDLLLSRPVGAAQRAKARLRRLLLARVHLFALYYRNTRAIQEAYKIPARKFRYVPFKINQQRMVVGAATADKGYVFCGGKTRRDFATLVEAARGTGLPVRIVTMRNEQIAEHGSFLDADNLPENVEAVMLDGSFAPFLKQMAESRLVALPLLPDICGAGIGVCIMAMALGKCVVISDGVSVDGVLDDGKAVIVPPRDPVALRSALTGLYRDPDLRGKYEKRGRDYALSLGGEERLVESVIGLLLDDAGN